MFENKNLISRSKQLKEHTCIIVKYLTIGLLFWKPGKKYSLSLCGFSCIEIIAVVSDILSLFC